MKSLGRIIGRGGAQSDDQWIPVSDLMAGLMVIFLFIAITHVQYVDRAGASRPAETGTPESALKDGAAQTAIRIDPKNEPIYQALERALQNDMARLANEVATERQLVGALDRAFRDDLKAWNAEIDADDLTVRFNAPESLFEANSANLKGRFKRILESFIPRYLEVLGEYREHIDEIRIEGHSSSEWAGATNADEAYFKNLELSQARARTTLEYGLSTALAAEMRQWAKGHITTSGMSSSRPRLTDGQEDKNLSRRVEFRIQTTAREQAEDILQTLDDVLKTRKFLDPQK